MMFPFVRGFGAVGASGSRRVFRPLPVAVWLAALIVPADVALGEAAADPTLASFQSSLLPVLQEYCYDCHGDGSRKGGVAFDDFAKPGKLTDHDFWLRVLRNVRAGSMPPADEDQPSAEQRAQILGWIKQHAFELDAAQPDPGRIVVRRLNRAEYRNTVKDLLGADFDTEEEFPADDTGFGFDNIGSVLTVSPTLLEKLLDAAQKVVSTAVPTQPYVVAKQTVLGKEFQRVGPDGKLLANPPPDDPGVPPEFIEFLGPDVMNARYLSFYEPAVVRRTFAAAAPGTFEFALELQVSERLRLGGDQPGPDQNRCKVVFRVDGVAVAEREFERAARDKVFPLTARAELTPGEHSFEFAVEPVASEAPQTRGLKVRFNEVEVKGPLQREHWVRPPHYVEYFGEHGPSADPKERRAFTTGKLKEFASRAFRRPVDDQTVDRLLAVVDAVASQPGHTYESAVAQAMVAVLASPRFVFREEGEEPLQPGHKYPLIDEYALASRLSYFLWSSMPDDELFRLASRHELRANLATQYERMLRDPKFNRFVADFTGQWLQARDVANVQIDSLSVLLRDQPDPAVDAARATFRAMIERDPISYTKEEAAAFDAADKLLKKMDRVPKPQLTKRLRQAMRDETQLFFASIVQEDRSVLELIESNYTFLNEELAKHYGIPDVKGAAMRKVVLPPDSPRGGVLTQATVLAVTSNPTRTSPVKRGVFILDNILGLPPAPPPPNIPALEAVASPDKIKKMSMREQIALHAGNSLCRSCHNRMDPLGLALDNFNALGVWRDQELGQPIDSSGKLISGEKFAGARDLKHILVTSKREDFYYCLSDKLLTYALGRGMEYSDTTLLDTLVARLDATGGRMSSLLKGIVESPAFQRRRATVETLTAGSQVPSPEISR